jgi:hypothetical protein
MTDETTKRKIVQITVVQPDEHGRLGPVLFALCEDGTVWSCCPDKKSSWSQVRPISDPVDEAAYDRAIADEPSVRAGVGAVRLRRR